MKKHLVEILLILSAALFLSLGNAVDWENTTFNMRDSVAALHAGF